ncbi:methyltransferase domain-containing protein [Rhodohalobacter sp. SW132]|uniref:class I SAM-dependent methyltransferase n=1 Tax=Rhodohalobacter sp. SW132 TaxID=2293433 RepID=UPI000E27DC23|nr:methyltransferase domain-containing protein [Rhodohalobacter sp. SW132]REL38878.1 methyltransferase domain-containing protein [Rhodohalobacter sp. SW132]
MSKIDFFKTFIKDRDVASVIPTSMRCVKKVCTHIDFSQDFTLVEYGPGNGVFTKYLLDKMTEGSRLILIEANEDFVTELNETIKDPRVSINNVLAGDVETVLDPDQVGNVDYVLSGIPFSFLKKDRKRAVLIATKRILKDGGKFIAYQTSGHLKKPVMEVFGNYDIEFEMLNIPPYLIYDVVKNSNGAESAAGKTGS